MSLIRTNNLSTTISFLDPLTHTDDSQAIPIDIKRQPEKLITAIPIFMRITMPDDKHPQMTFFPVNSPLLKGTTLWRAILRHCANGTNNSAVLTKAKRDKRTD